MEYSVAQLEKALENAKAAGARPEVVQELERALSRTRQVRARATASEDPLGRLEAGIRGGMQGFTFGGHDEIAGLLGDDRDVIRERNRVAKDAYPGTYGIANFLGTAGGAVTGGGALARLGAFAGKKAATGPNTPLSLIHISEPTRPY